MGLAMKRLWIAFATEDIGDQHRRTTLGPLWLLVNYLAFTGTFLVIFGRGSDGSDMTAYIAVGLLVWFYISEVITQGITLFVREESFIKGTPLPLSVYVLRQAMQSTLRSGYALVGCVAILLFTGMPSPAGWLWAAASIALLIAATPAVITICGFAGAFFPDLQFVVSNLMRLGLFLTPIFWIYTGNGGVREVFYYWNPFTYFLEIVRQPIITGDLPLRSFLLCGTISLVLWLIALLMLGRFRRQVVFVL